MVVDVTVEVYVAEKIVIVLVEDTIGVDVLVEVEDTVAVEVMVVVDVLPITKLAKKLLKKLLFCAVVG